MQARPTPLHSKSATVVLGFGQVVVVVAAIAALFVYPSIGTTQTTNTPTQKEYDELQSELKDKRSNYQGLQDEITQYKENLKTKQQEKTTLNNQLEVLDENISLTQTEIEATGEEIEILELEIDQLELQITDTQSTIDDTKDTISDLIIGLYNFQQQTLLEVALTNSTLSEFSHQVEYTENANAEFKRSLDNLQDLKKDLKSDKREVTDKQSEQEQKLDELEVQEDNLKGEVGYKETLLFDVEADEVKFQELIDDIQSEQQAINSEITQLEKSARQTLDELNKNKPDPDPTDPTTPTDPDTPTDPGTPIELPTSFNPDWPLRGIVTATFKDPTYPFRGYFEHAAVDIAVGHGTAIRAADSGVVSVVRYNGTSDYAYVAIVHADNFQTVYGHTSAVYVQPEQVVEKGEIIALSGATPGTVGAGRFTTGPHLHFEVWLSGVKVDPMIYLP